MSEKITAEDIRTALEASYKTPEWYIGFEVGNSTGSNCRRHADAVAVNAYPSKGFETRGFEIKVSKSDLKAELENGIKSDEIARFCDYWFLVVPKGLADGFTLPPTWGVIEYKDGALRQKSKAERLQKIAPTTGFLCAMLRSRERAIWMSATTITADEEARIKRAALLGIKNSEKELTELRKKLDEINVATGISLDSWRPTEKIINRLKAADALDVVANNVKYLARCAESMMKDAQEIQAVVDAMNRKEHTNVKG